MTSDLGIKLVLLIQKLCYFQAEYFLIEIWEIMAIDDRALSQPVHVTGIEYQGELDKKAFSPITYRKVQF